MTALSEGEVQQAREIALANRILAGKDIVDGFGHVAARSADRPDHFLLARNMAPALVTPTDVLLFDLDGNCVSAPDARVYLERFIHGEIFRVRGDVQAVVHAHAVSVLPFAVVPDVPIRPIYHMSGFIGEGLPVFEIRACRHDSDMLIRDAALGVALAQTLGQASGVLMRGHGFTIVGESVQQAVYRAVYLDLNARVQAAAMALGDPVYLNPAEAKAAEATIHGQIHRPWELWARDVGDAP
jgi:ribulose-5-phosphate 4-epimerase/fuculose-1-phosphate aldolase